MDNASLPCSSSGTPRQGLLLVGHGTRDEVGQREFLELAHLVRARQPERIVEAAFLELAEPTIADAVARLLAQGVTQCAVMPLLLFAAGHAKQDIPAAVATAVGDAPLAWWQAPHLGCHSKILELSALRMQEALAQHAPIADEETLLLLVGRGSRDDSATVEMLRFAQLRAEQTVVGRVQTCFYAMAQPELGATLNEVASSGFRRIVVQPHLLFSGDLSHRLLERVALAARQNPRQQWLTTAHLGANDLVVDAVVDIAPSRNANTIVRP